MDLTTYISLLASLASLILAIIAIWLALYHKKESDKTNSQTRDILTDIKTDAKIVSAVALPELKAYGDSMREFVLHTKKSESSKETTDSEYLSNMNRIQKTLDDLKKESDIRKVRTGLDSIGSKLQKSQNDLSKSKTKGISIKISDTVSVSTSNSNETWNDLLKFVFSMSKDINKENYLKYWKLIRSKDGHVVPEKFIKEDNFSFGDIGLCEGDQIILERKN